MFTPQADLDLALAMARQAAAIALGQIRNGLATQTKSDGSPVTRADLLVEQELVSKLARERPDDGILGEEYGESGRSSRRWIIDPIDGTFNLVKNDPQWGTHIALEEAGEIILGVISRPARDRVWWAARGAGTYTGPISGKGESVSCQVSEVGKLNQSRISSWQLRPNTMMENLAALATLQPPELDDYLRVITGEMEAVCDPGGKAWDLAPAKILVEEAGGRFFDLHGGRRIDLGGGWLTNGRIDDALAPFIATN